MQKDLYPFRESHNNRTEGILYSKHENKHWLTHLRPKRIQCELRKNHIADIGHQWKFAISLLNTFQLFFMYSELCYRPILSNRNIVETINENHMYNFKLSNRDFKKK